MKNLEDDHDVSNYSNEREDSMEDWRAEIVDKNWVRRIKSVVLRLPLFYISWIQFSGMLIRSAF